jgi:glutamate-ammonia-ligase adenylyltransferase
VSDSFIHSADPCEAATFFADFCTAYKSFCGRLLDESSCAPDVLTIFGNSRFLALHLMRHPEEYDTLLASRYRQIEKPMSVFQTEVSAALKNSEDSLSALKRYKYRELIRLTIKELKLEDQRVIWREMSHLITALVNAHTQNAVAAIAVRQKISIQKISPFALLAMGKLGGHEINYSSDIDLIGLYDRDSDLGDISQHEFFERLFTKLGQDLGHNDENGFLYRVDWDLRPEGKTGTLANSFDAMEAYYATFGADWERQAYVRARVLQETKSLGASFLALMEPFIYRKSLEQDDVKRIVDTQVLDMKDRIAAELRLKHSDGLNIKLDQGGIRDIEFFIQGLQLIYGGRKTDVRTPNTFEALEALCRLGIVPIEKADLLAKAYRYLRRVETALQMEDEKQTHTLRSKPGDRLKIARRLGLKQADSEAIDIFTEELENTRNLVRQTFAEFYER